LEKEKQNWMMKLKANEEQLEEERNLIEIMKANEE
jgi:hypothetical protein